MEQERLIPRRGNYQKLLSYQKTEVIYEMTYYFCERFLLRGDRTIDQMVQEWMCYGLTIWAKAAL